MNWDAIGAIAESIGAIGVVASLVYLARQIRHNAEATRIAAYHQGQEQLWATAVAISTDPGLARIFSKSFSGDLDNLEFTERVRLEFALGTFFFGMESMMALYERGNIDPELWQNVFENNFRLLGSPLGRQYLATRPGSISRRLSALIEEHTKSEE